MNMSGIAAKTGSSDLNGLRPMERNRAMEENFGSFRETLDEVNQLLVRAGDYSGRRQLLDRLVTQCTIIRAVLQASDDGGCRRILFSFARALTILSDLAAKGYGAIELDATKRKVGAALASMLSGGSADGKLVGTLGAWIETAEFVRTYRDDLLGKVDPGLLKLDIPLREALPDEPGLAPIVDELVENPPSGAASELYAAAAMNLRSMANSVTDANAIVRGCGRASGGDFGRPNAVLCRAEILR